MPREMTRSLSDAIDSLGAAERRSVIRGIRDPILASLMRGLRAEMRAADQREADVIAALADDRRAWLDDVDRQVHGDPAPVEGEPWWPNVDGPDDGAPR
jgi:hypothetical protein